MTIEKLRRPVNKKWNLSVNKMELLVAALHCETGGIMLKVHAKKLDAVAVLCLEGQVINGDTDILRSAVQSASGAGDIILDLANVSVVDAHGLGVLLQLREQAFAKGADFKLLNVRKSLYRIFEITRLHTVFEITRDVQLLSQVRYSQRMPMAA